MWLLTMDNETELLLPLAILKDSEPIGDDWNELNSLQNVDYRELPPTSPFVFVDPGEVLELMRRFVSLQRFRKLVKDDDEDECHMDFIPSNFLVIHSTVAGSHSLQNNKSNCCSWFISAIIYNFRAHVHNEHVERILQRVKDETSHPSRKSFVTQGINEQSWVINKLKSHLFLKPPKALEAYKYKNLFETS